MSCDIWLDNVCTAPAVSAAPVKGLVLCGGASQRMGRDKAMLRLAGKTLLQRAVALLSPLCDEVYLSGKTGVARACRGLPDLKPGLGPISGLHAAYRADPKAGWLLLAVDMPGVRPATLQALLAARDGSCQAVAYRGANGLEPTCALYEHSAGPVVAARIKARRYSLRGLLGQLSVTELAGNADDLINVNTPEAWAAFQSGWGPHSA